MYRFFSQKPSFDVSCCSGVRCFMVKLDVDGSLLKNVKINLLHWRLFFTAI